MAKNKRVVKTDRERLGRLLRDALIAASVKHNPWHDRAEFQGLSKMGMVGFEHVAGELLAAGVRLPLAGAEAVEAPEVGEVESE